MRRVDFPDYSFHDDGIRLESVSPHSLPKNSVVIMKRTPSTLNVIHASRLTFDELRAAFYPYAITLGRRGGPLT